MIKFEQSVIERTKRTMAYVREHETELPPRTITVNLEKNDNFLSRASREGSAPLGTVLLSVLVPSAALVTFSFTYGALTSAAIGVAMFFSILYVSRKVARLSCRAPVVQPRRT